MTKPDRDADTRPTHFAVELDGGRTITGPLWPDDCEWVAVSVDGTEIHHTCAANVAASPLTELTRLAERLCPGRAATRNLPTPEGAEDYGPECAVRAACSGRTLRFQAAPKEVEYLRVCDPAGAEIASWSDNEFAEDAPDILGTCFGCLASTTERP